VFQPSLRDYSSSISRPRIASWAKFSRPYGTFFEFFRDLYGLALIRNMSFSAFATVMSTLEALFSFAFETHGDAEGGYIANLLSQGSRNNFAGAQSLRQRFTGEHFPHRREQALAHTPR